MSMFNSRKLQSLLDLENSRNEILQERIDLLKEEVKLYSDAVSEWRRLYTTKFDMIKGELAALNGWVATVAASSPGIPLPSTVDLDPEKVFEGLDSLGPIGGEDLLADMTLENLLGYTTPAPVTDEEIAGDDAETGEDRARS